MEIRDFLSMTEDLDDRRTIYADAENPLPLGIIRVTDDAAVLLAARKPLTLKDAKKQLNLLKKENKLMFFLKGNPRYVFGFRIEEDRLLLK